MKVSVLGVSYTIRELYKSEDNMLKKCDGYCDKTTHSIVIIKEDATTELDDWRVYRNKILRHELIHAFLFESGLHENFEHPSFGHDETYVDWFAAQYPKLQLAFQKCGCD